MRSMWKKIILLTLALMLLISCVPLLPVAAEQPSTGRFVFSFLRSGSGRTYQTADTPVTLALSATERTFEAGELSLLSGQSNAFYLALVNHSNAEALEISYTYTEHAIPKKQTVSVPLEKNSNTLQLLTPQALHITENVSALSLTFVCAGTLSGTVTLHKLFNFSTYANDTVYEARFTECGYNEEKGTIDIAGELSFEATAFYGDRHTLALFALSSEEELHLSSKTPIARTGISLNFSFSVEMDSADALFSRYVVAAVNEKGERIPLCSPIYPSVKYADSVVDGAFKGFHTEQFSTVLDATPGIEVIDVYLDRLPDENGNGILYAGEHSYYHFNQEYVEQIDKQVRNLTGMGTQVYLRFLISANANGLSFTDYSDSGLGVVNKLPAIRDEAAVRDVYAITNFLTSRYADASIGRISGIVLGRSADLAATYNYTAATTLADYTKLYATALNLISVSAARNIPDICMVVPVSDRIWPGVITEEQQRGNYYSELFLHSLLTALQEQVIRPQRFFLMLESNALPDFFSAGAGNHYGIDRLDDFLQMLYRIVGERDFAQKQILYAWSPAGDEGEGVLGAAYLLQYATLSQNEAVRSFLVDLSTAEADGKTQATTALSYLARYIDTDRAEIAAQSALRLLGVSSLRALYADTVPPVRKIHQTSLYKDGYQRAAQPMGSYTVWNFEVATGTLGWYAGDACLNLSVLNDTQHRRSLCARMETVARGGDIAYHFSEPTDLSFAPLIKMNVEVEGATGTRYEIQLRTVGKEDTVLASAILTQGERTDLYLDLAASKAALSSVNGIRLLARSLDGEGESFELHFYSLTLESDSLSDSELSRKVNDLLTGTEVASEEQTEKRDFTRPLVVSAILLLVSAAITAILVIRRKTRRLSRDKK